MIRKNVTGQKKRLQSPIMYFIAIIQILSFCSDWDTPQFQFTVCFMILTAKKKEILAVVGFESTSPKRSVPFLYIKGPVCSQNYCL